MIACVGMEITLAAISVSTSISADIPAFKTGLFPSNLTLTSNVRVSCFNPATIGDILYMTPLKGLP